MSAENPEVGDVWTFQQDPPAPAVIVSELMGANGFQLMARNGRIINVTRSSLRQMWTYTGTSHTGPCSIGGCLLTASVLVRDSWYCGSHAPRNQPVQLPGDQQTSTPNQPVNGTLSRCPRCNMDRDANAAMTLIEEVTVHRCACRARWISLMAQGTSEDGLNLGEDLQAAYDILESEFCAPIQAFIGTAALGALRRAFTEIDGDNPRFAGIGLTVSFAYGSDTVLVVGSPASSNDEEKSINDRLNTYWRHKERIGIIGRVIRVEENTREDREVILADWSTPSLVLTMTEAALLRDYTPSESPTITNINGATHISFPPEYVGRFPTEPLTVDADLPELFDVVQTSDSQDKQPIPGETWWNVSTGQADQVFAIGRRETGEEYVRTTTAEGQAGRMLVADFIRYSSFNHEDEVNIVVGGEYVNAEDGTWTIKAVALPVISLINGEGAMVSLRLAEFRARFKQLIRRSAADRLLDEEDLV